LGRVRPKTFFPVENEGGRGARIRFRGEKDVSILSQFGTQGKGEISEQVCGKEKESSARKAGRTARRGVGQKGGKSAKSQERRGTGD